MSFNNATIQKVENVERVENSDNLEKVKVLGWQVIVKSGEFKIGDLCVFITIDTIVPDKPEFEFLRNRNFRIRSIKLRGEISQGIVFPLSILENQNVNIGDDVSEIIGVKHYEKPIPVSLGGFTKGGFPSFLISRTDEERIQNIPDIVHELKDYIVYSSVKCNGMSASYINHNDENYICSRNLSIKLNGKNLYTSINEKYDILNKLKKSGIAIQGEICGEKIQDNNLCIKGHKLFIFNVFDVIRQKYLNFDEVQFFCQKNEFDMVPIDKIFKFNHSVDELLKMADGYYEGTNNFREGIVIRPVVEMYSEVLKGRMSFKVLSNKYLLKNSE